MHKSALVEDMGRIFLSRTFFLLPMSVYWASWKQLLLPLSLGVHSCLHILWSVTLLPLQKNILYFSCEFLQESVLICTKSDKAQLAALIRSVTPLTNIVCTLPFGANKANCLSFVLIFVLRASQILYELILQLLNVFTLQTRKVKSQIVLIIGGISFSNLN